MAEPAPSVAKNVTYASSAPAEQQTENTHFRLDNVIINAKTVSVLLIEDSSSDAFLISDALKDSYEGTDFMVARVSTLAHALETLKSTKFNVILLDLGLPDSKGIDTFLHIHAALPNCPVIILSGSIDGTMAGKALGLGAQDFLPKQEISRFNITRTISYAITRWHLNEVERLRGIAERQRVEKMSAMKSQFLANMSHEIRSPMNGVIGMTSLLLNTNLTEEQSEYVNGIRSAGASLMEIISDILDYSKIEAGKIEIEEVDFNPRQVVEETMDLFSQAAVIKKIQLTSLVMPDVPRILFGDPTRVRQIITNLVGNAIKFTEAGQVSIRVQKKPQSANQDISVEFSVSDTGVGISEEYQASLFQPFTQEDATTTRRFGGTGLGLTICKKLVELMAGELNVQSKVGVGSEFSVSIPFKKNQSIECALRSNLTGKVVAIAVDEKFLRSSVHEQLTLRGMNVVDFREDALRDVSLVITDHELSEGERSKLTTIDNSKVLLLIPKIQNVFNNQNYAVLRYPYKQSDFYRRIAELIDGKAVDKPLPAPKSISNDAIIGRVLVVEDSKINQTVAIRMLKKLGFTFDVAANGLEALTAVQNCNDYCAILMDCQMPEMDGFEATRRIRMLEDGNASIPVIAVTANAFTEDKEKCAQAGMDAYLSKPIQMEDLEDALKKCRREVAVVSNLGG